MREIKFRAWDENKKKMIFGPTDDNPNSSWVLALSGMSVPVMQFTGLHDKNGKEIYEWDILKTYLYGIGVVKFGEKCNSDAEDSSGNFVGYYVECGGKICQIPYSLEDVRDEIIGNIHENPDLLK